MYTLGFARLIPCYCLIVWICIGGPCAEAKMQPLFATDIPLEIRLTGPWWRLASDSAEEPKPRLAKLALADGTQFNLKVEPRGKSRRQKAFCAFPPLRLDFKRAEVKDSVFEGQNKLKLVTHCGRLGIRNKEYSDRLHSEYLLYRILQEIDHRSFLVRAVRITYVDNERDKTYSHPGFFIEHKRALADRLESIILAQPRIPLAELDASYATNVALFAYFAGNTDFAFTSGPKGKDCCHNAVPMRSNTSVLAVPYDFDSTGFVNPPYAAPLPSLKLKRVTQRLYRGYCEHKQQVPEAITRFQNAKAKITALITDHDDLTARRKNKLLSFMEGFYTVLNDPRKANSRILKTCH